MIHWRDACEMALRDFSDADSIRFWRVAHTIENSDGLGAPIQRPIFNYRFEHTQAAVLIARWLCPKVGADLDIVECACWLHDVTKQLKDPMSKDTHAQDASERIPDILEGTDFPRVKIPAVQHAIEHHVGLKLTRKLEPLETACLWDCDKLSKIGAASLVHFGCISGAFQPITTADILERGEKWLELAKDIVDSFNTDVAREEGQRRLAFITSHYAQLRREWTDPIGETPPSP